MWSSYGGVPTYLTGKRLANYFQKQNDPDNYETIVRWAMTLDSDFRESLEP